jgi:two-component system nitrate/nitrite sensor histidine kinase NarX
MRIRLGTKLLAVQLVALAIALASIGLTLLITWKLEGGAAAINDAGSLRMRSYRLAYLAEQVDGEGRGSPTAELLRREIADFDSVLATLRRGDPARPLFLPDTEGVRQRLQALDSEWGALSRQVLAPGPNGAKPVLDRAQVERFVATVNSLVVEVEADLSRTTSLLRAFQLGLVLLAIAGTVALTYLSFLFILRPVMNLKEGIERMAGADFSVRLPRMSDDELGLVTAGFNRMAEELQALYGSLEARVESKTRSLAEQNARLATLYDMTAFLGAPHALEDLARGFLRRVMAGTNAAAASVRLTQEADAGPHPGIAGATGAAAGTTTGAPGTPGARRLLLFVHEGLPADFVETERCLPSDRCACGDAVVRAAPVVHVLQGKRLALALPHCRDAGFATVAAFPVVAQGAVIGIYNLFFAEPRELGVDERHLLDTLGRHFGVAIRNRELASREREMAISEERNLLAQQLHDSIAQSLAFLNLQVQMLRDAIARGDDARAREDLTGVQAGVQETYADVRELLTHFRMRVGEGSLEEAVSSLLQRFERQTGIVTSLEVEGAGLAPSPEAQLQILHVAQEALSNARKHAECSHVDVAVSRGPVYRLAVRDDGRGFDPVATHAEEHVGLAIMRERAQRIGASLEVRSTPGTGTEVIVELAVEQKAGAVAEAAE